MAKIKANKDDQNFLVRHVEKFVAVFVLVLTGVLGYLGYSQEGLPSDKTADKLSSGAASAKQHIENPENWKNIAPTISISTGQIEQVQKSQSPTSALAYAWDKPLEPVNVQAGKRREDPKLFAAEKIETVVVTAPVVYMPLPGEEDLLALETNSAQEVKKVKKPKKSRNNMDGGYLGEGYGDAMAKSEAQMGMPGDMMMAGTPGMGTAAGGIAADQTSRKGFRAAMGMATKPQTCVAVKAIVPWKKQFEEYEQRFQTALGYSPTRDMPRYFSFTAERAEVTSDPNAELKWKRVAFTSELMRQYMVNEIEVANGATMKFAGYCMEAADPRYVFPGVLTWPVPPFVERDPVPLATHSLVPKAKIYAGELTPEQKERWEKKKAEMRKKKDSDAPGYVPSLPNAGMMGGENMPGGSGGTMGGGMGMPGMPGMGMPGMPGGGMPGMPGGGMSGMPGGGMPGGDMYGSEMGMGMGGMMGMPGGMPGSEGMYGGGYGAEMMNGGSGMGAMTYGPQVDYLLIRFFDFNVELGKKYRYRIQLMLEDPNHPFNPSMEPLERFLDESVKVRVQGVEAQEEKAKKERVAKEKKKTGAEANSNPLQDRIYYLRSEYSEPSDVVSVEIAPSTVAGAIVAAKSAPLPEKEFKDAPPGLNIPVDEPSGKIMSVVWDGKFGVDVPGTIDVTRGTVLNFNSHADVIHPTLLVFKKLNEVQFQTDRIVADIRGGIEFPHIPAPGEKAGTKVDPVLSVGEYAVVDEHGNLRVFNEFDDFESFKRLNLPAAPETSSAGVMPEQAGKMPGDATMPGDGVNRGRGRKEK